MKKFLVTEKAMRPAGNGARECFYCREPIGGSHKESCPTVMKRVRMRMTVEYVVDIPAHWTGKDAEFQRNDGGRCASNAISELEERFGQDGEECMCGGVRFEYIGDTAEDIFIKE